MNNKTIAVIFGGKSPEHEVSVDSAKTICDVLSTMGYKVLPVYISRKGIWYLSDPKVAMSDENAVVINPSLTEKCFLSDNKKIYADIIFPIIHGSTGEDGILQGMLEMFDVPYVGSGVGASSIGMNKVITKQIVKETEVSVLPQVIITRHDEDKNTKIQQADKMEYPLFVKPVSQGSSVGITKVKKFDELMSAVDYAMRFDRAVMIEQGVDFAREMVCGVLGNDKHCEASLVGEVIPQGKHEYYDYESKYLDENGMKLVIPAILENSNSELIRSWAVKIFKAVGACGFARVDFFMDRKTSKIWFGEINTAPGFTSHSLYPSLWAKTGKSASIVIQELLDIAQEEYKVKNSFVVTRK